MACTAPRSNKTQPLETLKCRQIPVLVIGFFFSEIEVCFDNFLTVKVTFLLQRLATSHNSPKRKWPLSLTQTQPRISLGLCWGRADGVPPQPAPWWPKKSVVGEDLPWPLRIRSQGYWQQRTSRTAPESGEHAGIRVLRVRGRFSGAFRALRLSL